MTRQRIQTWHLLRAKQETLPRNQDSVRVKSEKEKKRKGTLDGVWGWGRGLPMYFARFFKAKVTANFQGTKCNDKICATSVQLTGDLQVNVSMMCLLETLFKVIFVGPLVPVSWACDTF